MKIHFCMKMYVSAETCTNLWQSYTIVHHNLVLQPVTLLWDGKWFALDLITQFHCPWYQSHKNGRWLHNDCTVANGFTRSLSSCIQDAILRLLWNSAPWQRHQMKTFSALMALCEGNSPVTGGLPSQKPMTRSFDVLFDPRPNKRLTKQSRRLQFEKKLRLSWRHWNVSW